MLKQKFDVIKSNAAAPAGRPRIIFVDLEDAFDKLGIHELCSPMMDKNRGRNFCFTLGGQTDEDRLSMEVKPLELDENKDPKRISVSLRGKDKRVDLTLVQMRQGVGLEEASVFRKDSSGRLSPMRMGCHEMPDDQEYPLTEVIFATKRTAQQVLELGGQALPGDLRNAHAFLERRFEIIAEKTRSGERDYARRKNTFGQDSPVFASDS